MLTQKIILTVLVATMTLILAAAGHGGIVSATVAQWVLALMMVYCTGIFAFCLVAAVREIRHDRARR